MNEMELNPHLVKRVREPIEIEIPCRSKLRKWAFENAYMLILMAFLFGITWAYILIQGLVHATG